MPNYIYNNNVYSQQQVEQAAAAKQMSLEEYINEFGIKTVGDQKQEDKEKLESISWFDQTWFGRGFKAASTTGEATNLMAQDFSNISEDAIQDFIKAKEKESTTYQESSSMKAFQKQYIKEGKTWVAFFRGVRRNPKLLPELFIQSIGTQVGTLADSPGATLAAVGAGAVTARS